ncbi:hypothetical protein NQ315_002695 [Exocentrus adspersus]|uniref:DDE Tnp4 domain-containing protein n=1 Tax=Exocentrus adspersus TaxID=1586481 RepID=A0AAV8VI05_9CUCU|nr:hypothetical protein NQ315_002695 [Exocentrus adspersus]
MVATIIFLAIIPHMERESPLAIHLEHNVLIALHFYASGSYQKCIGLNWQFPSCQQTVSKIIHEVSTLVCDYDLEILNINARYGGATHDAFIYRQSAVSTELERRYTEGDINSWLLADSGYPQKPYLMTPVVDARPGTPEYNYTRRHVLARNAVERCNGVWKARFRCLSGERKLRYKPDMVGDIANVCAVLHNIRTKGRLDIPENVPEAPPEPIIENVAEHVILSISGKVAHFRLCYYGYR